MVNHNVCACAVSHRCTMCTNDLCKTESQSRIHWSHTKHFVFHLRFSQHFNKWSKCVCRAAVTFNEHTVSVGFSCAKWVNAYMYKSKEEHPKCAKFLFQFCICVLAGFCTVSGSGRLVLLSIAVLLNEDIMLRRINYNEENPLISSGLWLNCNMPK